MISKHVYVYLYIKINHGKLYQVSCLEYARLVGLTMFVHLHLLFYKKK